MNDAIDPNDHHRRIVNGGLVPLVASFLFPYKSINELAAVNKLFSCNIYCNI